MKIEHEIDDEKINAMLEAELAKQIRDKVSYYLNLPKFSNAIFSALEAHISSLAGDVVLGEKIRSCMDEKVDKILPSVLNDKFIGAYMAVVISKARDAAAEATKNINHLFADEST